MAKHEAVAAAIRNCGGHLVKGGEFVEAIWYEFKARFDDQEQIDEFLDNNFYDIGNNFYTDIEKGCPTLWFNMKG